MDRTNTIAEEQNTPKQIERLAAQRFLYSQAKRMLVLQVLFIGLVPISATVISTFQPGLKDYAALVGLLLALFDALVIDRYQLSCKKQAAKIQELFDCDLFKLPWRELKLGPAPAVETIVSAAAQHRKRYKSDADLHDWYPPNVSQTPLRFGRVICQRVNCWWDSTQRRQYASWLVIANVAVVGILVVVSLLRGLSLVNFLLTIGAVSPLIIWGIREYKRQIDACNSSDQLRHLPSTTDEQSAAISREIQDEIYDQRKSNPFVFDWIYRRLRSAQEVQMKRGVEEFINEATLSLAIR